METEINKATEIDVGYRTAPRTTTAPERVTLDFKACQEWLFLYFVFIYLFCV